MTDTSIDPQAFRQALGNFATGVTIITTRAPDGEPVGLTVSSFNSVSLNPPLVLWSLADSSNALDIFRDAEHWAVHVLSSEQEQLSNLFAQAGEDKFAGLTLESGLGDTPLLTGCSARFQCKTAFQYEGGDHQIFVGQVLDFDRDETAPLVFHGGRYAHATARDKRTDNPKNPWLGGSFNDNFLGYLLGRSHYKFYSRIRPLLQKEQLTDEEFYVMSTLTLKRDMTREQIDAVMSGVIDEAGHEAVDSLIQRGYALREDDSQAHEIHLTDAGSAIALKVISAAKGVESQVTEGLGYEETSVLKSLLHQLLDSIDPEANALWDAEAP